MATSRPRRVSRAESLKLPISPVSFAPGCSPRAGKCREMFENCFEMWTKCSGLCAQTASDIKWRHLESTSCKERAGLPPKNTKTANKNLHFPDWLNPLPHLKPGRNAPRRGAQIHFQHPQCATVGSIRSTAPIAQPSSRRQLRPGRQSRQAPSVRPYSRPHTYRHFAGRIAISDCRRRSTRNESRARHRYKSLLPHQAR